MLTIMLHTCETDAEAAEVLSKFDDDDEMTVVSARVRGSDETIIVCAVSGGGDDGIGWAAIELMQRAMGLHDTGVTMQ